MSAGFEFHQTLQALNQITAILNQSPNITAALNATLASLVDLMGLETGWIFLRDSAAQNRWAGRGYVLAATSRLPPALAVDRPTAWDKGCDCQTLCRQGLLEEAYNEVRCSRLAEAKGNRRGLAVHASAPLRGGADVLGILNVAAGQWDAFSPEALALFTNVGRQMGIAVERARLYDMLQSRRIHEQQALLDLSQQLLGHPDLEDLLQVLVAEVRQLLQVDACAILLPDANQEYLRFHAASGWRSDPVGHGYQVPITGSGSGAVMQSQQRLTWNSRDEIPRLSQGPFLAWLREEGFESAAILPLIAGGVSIGTLVIDMRRAREFEEAELRLLQLLANQAAIAIEKARLRQQELERHRIEKELAVGREIQLSMLPASSPQVPGWDVAVDYEAARQVGGDFYDHFFLPDRPDCLGLVVADVSDKGVPAALFMALSRTTIRNAANGNLSPAETLSQANRFFLTDVHSDMFLTVVYGILNVVDGDFTFANAGHNRPLWWRHEAGRMETLEQAGIVLGIVEPVQLPQCTVRLAPGDVLILYTDGVTEAMNARREEFRVSRLIRSVTRLLARRPDATAQDVVEAISQAIVAFTGHLPQYDDVTMLVIRRHLDGC